MQGTILVQVNATLGFNHVLYRDVVLATPADVQAWEDEIAARLGPSPYKDVIVNLGGITVKPQAMAAYDVARRRITTTYVQRIYRYAGNPAVRTKILTSSTLNGDKANVFVTFEDALRAFESDTPK